MFDKFKQIGELKKMRDSAMQMQRELEGEEVVHDENGVRVVMTGNQKIKMISINGKEEERVAKVINKAIEKSQQVAAKKIQSMGGLGGLGGLLGN